jgi:hypothetical protein
MLLPSKVIATGGGLHAYWLFKEALPATPENIAHVESLLRLLADHVGGDLACAEASRLMRLPGSHNTKGGAWREVCVIADRQLRYEMDDLAEWLEVASPTIRRKPAGGNGGASADVDNPWLAVGERFTIKPPIDVEARLAAMTYQGVGDSGIHATQISVSAALLNRGQPIDDVVEIVLAATRAAAGAFGERWNWQREHHAVRQMCETWLAKHPEAEEQRTDKAETKKSSLHWYGETDSMQGRAWLVENLLPESGKGLVAGQWGVYKTFTVLDLAAAVMCGGVFIDFPIVRRGGVLFIATEGSSEIAVRLRAVLETKYPDIGGRVPFAWAETCPRLLDRGAANALVALAKEAAERMHTEFDVPLALIAIDTLVAAAGFTKAGEENDAAAGQMIMNVLEHVSRRTGALLLAVDHFGKAAETGTRGTSAKEGAADVVLALLAHKSITGEITGTKLAVRKRRTGPSGVEYPFTVRTVDLGIDRYGREITSLAIDWGKLPRQEEKPDRRDPWSKKSLKLLRQVLMNVLVEHGDEQRPFGDDRTVRAVDLEIVRREFYRSYPAEGDAAAKQAVRRKAFNRAIAAAQEQDLIGVYEVGALTLMWLTNPQNGPTKNA